jgi:hypothetical protein
MSILNTIQRTAVTLQWMKRPLLVLALGFLVVVVYIVLTSRTHAGDHYLVPSIIGLLWSLSAYAFIINFCAIQPPAEKDASFLFRLKRRLHRIWYGFLAFIFVNATLAVLFVSYRLLSIWLRGEG